MSKFCQSCGMPMKQDPKAGGTEKDGAKNLNYCSYCYEDGSFTQPNFTAKEMQNFCVEKMNEEGMPRFFAWILTRGVPRLERWRDIA